MNMTVRAERASGTTTKEGTTTRRTRQPVLLVPGGGKARHTHVAVEQREGTIASNRAFPRVRRDRIYPDTSSNHSGAIMSTELEAATEESKRLRRQRLQQKKQQQQHHLKVDTKASSHGRVESTPRTAASTPSTPNGVRGSSDLRSPGTKKTPRAAAPDDAHPDFITQTDRYGNATTPRSVTALQHAQEEDYNDQMVVCSQSREVVDVCAETFLDSLRIMCCCLVPDESDGAPKRHAVASETSPARLIRSRPALLPKIHPDDRGKKCLVLDLDETLVHSSFRAVAGADFVIPVQVRVESYGHKILTIFLQIEDVVHFVYVAKRPGVDEFLTEMAKHYELVIYTASLNKYADPLLDLLDPNRVIRTRLFRESCVYHEGNYVKDLSKLDRDLSQTIIIDNSPNSYSFHPENAIDCSSFIDDPRDRELDQIGAFLTGLKDVRDVRGVCRQWREWPNVSLHDQ